MDGIDSGRMRILPSRRKSFLEAPPISNLTSRNQPRPLTLRVPCPQLFGVGLAGLAGVLAVMVARERRGRPLFGSSGPSGFAGFSDSKANPLSHEVCPCHPTRCRFCPCMLEGSGFCMGFMYSHQVCVKIISPCCALVSWWNRERIA